VWSVSKQRIPRSFIAAWSVTAVTEYLLAVTIQLHKLGVRDVNFVFTLQRHAQFNIEPQYCNVNYFFLFVNKQCRGILRGFIMVEGKVRKKYYKNVVENV
jgi:hypothetical protein